MSLSRRTYSTTDLGAVLIQARLQTSNLMQPFMNIETDLRKKAVAALRADVEQQHAILGTAIFARSAIWSAAFCANCYFLYYSIFHDIEFFEEAEDISLAAVDAAHRFADMVPVELFNAQEVFASVEVLKLTEQQRAVILDCFRTHFPRLKAARDAVSHSHDRVFGRYYEKRVSDIVGSRSITAEGKIFLGADGNDFLFDFRLARFSALISDLQAVVNPKCA